MARSNLGAVRLPLLAAAVLAYFSVSLSAQVVERGRTFADLTASHPCASGYTDRIARVTDCDAAGTIGDGGGAFNCWAYCDGSAPWADIAIGGSAGGGAATAVEGSATLPATCAEKDLYQDTDSGGTEFYVCTAPNTWTKTGTGSGDVVGPASATDNCIATFNLTTGKLIQCNSAATLGDTGRLILDSSATAYATPTFAWSGDTDTGFTYEGVTGSTVYVADGAKALLFSGAGITASGSIYAGTITATTQFNAGGTAWFSGEIAYLSTALDLSASPSSLIQTYSNLVITNEGDTAEHVLNLPTASVGTKFTFVVQDADGIKVVAAAGDTIRPIAGTAASATGGFIRCATQGAFITLVAVNATEWVAIGSAGVWTIDV